MRDGDREFYGPLSISREEIPRLQGIVPRGKVTRAVGTLPRPLPRARVSDSRPCTELAIKPPGTLRRSLKEKEATCLIDFAALLFHCACSTRAGQ